jgi:hypothetical protein
MSAFTRITHSGDRALAFQRLPEIAMAKGIKDALKSDLLTH